jgi:hypothetical protein
MSSVHKTSSAISFLVGLVLFSSPSNVLAQHGSGGAIGGGSAGGTGMGSNGHPTGLDIKDDLRGFHDVLAVQATNEQAAAYAAMMRSTSAADLDLKSLEEQVRKENDSSGLANRAKQAQNAIEGARDLNKKFLEGFSEPQRTGMKEISKRLAKADSELAQQARALDLPSEAKQSGAQLLAVVDNLQHALSNFQHSQLDLGEEMSIPSASNGQGFTYNLVPVKNNVVVVGQAMTVTTSGVISKTRSEAGQNNFSVELGEDFSDLQRDIENVLRQQLESSDRCGERVAIQSAELTPHDATALVFVQLHFERWTCSPMFGRDSMNEIVEGNGTIEVRLSPAVAQDGTMKLTAQIGHVDAQGMIGDLLRTGSLGETIRDKTAQIFVSVMHQAVDFKSALPAGVRGYATLRRAEFQGTGSGRLIVRLTGEIQVSNDQLAAVTGELQRATQEPIPGPLLTRPATPQEAVTR